MTRAPRSANWRVANGAAMACSSVTTVSPLSGCISGSPQRRDRIHRQPAFMVLGPQLDAAVGLRLAIDAERAQVEGRANGLEPEGGDVGIGRVAANQVHQQGGDQGAVHD